MSRKSAFLKIILLSGALLVSANAWSAEEEPKKDPPKPPYDRSEAIVSPINPHNQIGETGEVLWGTCVICHKGVPDPQKAKTIKDVQLYFEDPVQLCRSCHTVPKHPGSEGVSVMMSGFKAPDHLREPPKFVVDNIRLTMKEIPLMMPFDPKTGKIVCSTCHNPHERGLLPGRADWGADYRFRLRSAGLDVCQYCHRK